MRAAPPRILVTGATGFVGRHVLARLAALGIEAHAFGRAIPPGLAHERALTTPDPADAAAVSAALRAVRPDAVLHLAGTTRVAPIEELYRINVAFAVHLCEAAAALAPAPRLLLLGTAAEYGPVAEEDLPVTEDTPCRPAGAYGISKLAQTLHGLAAAGAGVEVVVARLFNAVGPGMPEHLALGSFARQIAAMGPGGGTLVTGDLDVERDFMDVRDVARILVELALRPAVTGVVDICSGRPLGLRVLVEALIAAAGRPIVLRTDPARRGITTARRHAGAARRLAALGLQVPVPDPVALATFIVGNS